MFIVTLYGLSVKIETTHANLLHFIDKFIDRYYTVKSQNNGGPQTQPDKRFYSITADKKEIFLHTNQFKHLLYHAKETSFVMPDVTEKIDMRGYTHLNHDYKVRDGWELRPHQKPIYDFLLADPVRSKMVSLRTGGGKALTLDSKIKIPGGWQTMGSTKVGDVITSRDGTPTMVTGVYPQGIEQVYRVTFRDGRFVDCSGDHLWKVFNARGYKPDERWSVISTSEIKRLLVLKNHHILYVPLIESEIGMDVSLPLDPYLMGSLLGNGCLTRGPLSYSSSDHDHVEKLNTTLANSNLQLHPTSKYDYRVRLIIRDQVNRSNYLLAELKKLSLIGKLSYEKFIPKIYLEGSHQQRIALLQGLMDTDGTVDQKSTTSYSTASEQLAKDVQYLVRSLGGLASISVRAAPAYTYKGQRLIGRPSYRVNIRHPKPSTLFSLERKKTLANDDNQYAKTLKLRIVTVEAIGTAETQCISVDHPEKLFVTNDFTTTHNTATSLISLAAVGMCIAVVIQPTYTDQWLTAICSIHDATPKDVMVIQGSKSITGIVNMAREDTITAKYYIFSTRTLQDYISDYELDREICVMKYGCAPIDLFPLLGIGSLLIDETHQVFHALYRILIHTNVKFQVGLSATLLSDDAVVSRIHNVVYPKSCIYDQGELVKYTDVYSMCYSIPAPFLPRIKTANYGMTSYSHTAFEKSMTKDRQMETFYLRLIEGVLLDFFVNKYEADDKCLIFVGTVSFAARLVKYISQRYPEYKVLRYCEEDPFSNLLEADICVSTVISAGTAVDIPNLRTVIQTVSISSTVANIQSLGRLRQLPDKKDTRFCYLYADNITKHKTYHYKRKELFHERVATQTNMRARLA